MNTDTLVRVEGLSKKFCRDLKRSMWYGIQDVGSEVMGLRRKPDLRTGEFWAVNDVNFELRRGECLGLIGHNGAGKSTLLKMLNGLIKPDRGRITMQGRVGALIELGTGFNPILTGRENIYNNGAVLGFTQKEINKKIDAIVDFAEIGDFLDTPVQNYSSGMKVRLGFAVAAQMEPDVLLIDEVLAVGDMGFVLKCYNLIDQILYNSALILVSHNIPQIARTATQIMLLDRGVGIVHTSDVPAGISAYYQRYEIKNGNFQGTGDVDLLDLRLVHDGETHRNGSNLTIEYGDGMEIEIDVLCREKISEPSMYLAFYDQSQRGVAEIMNFRECIQVQDLLGKASFSLKLPSLPFTQGKYSISISFSDTSHGVLFRNQSVISFNVHGKSHGWTSVQFSPEWQMKQMEHLDE